jgi:hypothetical protein
VVGGTRVLYVAFVKTPVAQLNAIGFDCKLAQYNSGTRLNIIQLDSVVKRPTWVNVASIDTGVSTQQQIKTAFRHPYRAAEVVRCF